MTRVRHVCALLFGACLVLASTPGQGQLSNNNTQACKRIWSATVCGQETWDASQWLEALTLQAAPGQTTGHLVLLPGTEPNIDISLTVSTWAGDGALAGLIDVQTFVAQNPGIDLNPVVTACTSPDQAACDAAIGNLAGSVSQDQLQKAAVWWHGCIKASDNQSKTFTSLPPRQGYVIAAQAQGGSAVTIGADLTHHASPAQPHTERVCAPPQSGMMPADGSYANKSVGHISLAVTPQHGGTISGVTASVVSPVGDGSFKVDQLGNVTFTGTVNSRSCPAIPAPQHIPIRQMP